MEGGNMNIGGTMLPSGALTGGVRLVSHKALVHQALALHAKNSSGQSIESGDFPA
jgi:hypothetical protein